MINRCLFRNQCRLFNGIINMPEDTRLMYKYHYCLNNSMQWKECSRHNFNKNHGDCPDFIMPNSLMSNREIEIRSQMELTYQE